MSLQNLLNQSLSVQHMISGTPDALGDTPLATSGSVVTVSGYLEQQTTTENLLDRDTTTTYWRAFLPYSTVISHLDYISYASQKFQVNGEPWLVHNPRTQQVSHIICNLVEVNG
jgi:hypothetical protein